MSVKPEQTNPELLRALLEEAVSDGQPHKAGSLYDKFVERTGGIGADGKEISRKAFAMFLRGEVLAENGGVKCVAFGVYQKRDHPQDRGLVVARKSARGGIAFDDDCGASLYEALRPQLESEILSWEDVREDAVMLWARLKSKLEELEQVPDLPLDALDELRSITDSTLRNMDAALTGISAAIAWLDDHEERLDMEQQGWETFYPQGMKFG